MKNYLYLVLVLSGLIACLPSCDRQSENQQENEEYLPDSIDTEGIVDRECFSSPDYICEAGLEFVRLGDYIAEVRPDELGENAIQDSVEEGNGYEWLIRTLHFKEGRIVVEGEFLDQRVSNDTMLSQSRVNRLRIESPLFQTPDHIRVGTELGLLNQTFAEDSMVVFPLPVYEVINIQIYGQRYNYHIKDKGNHISSAAGKNLSIRDIPTDAKIAAIVVM